MLENIKLYKQKHQNTELPFIVLGVKKYIDPFLIKTQERGWEHKSVGTVFA